MIEFVVRGIPVGKGRPRMTKAGFAFTPKKTRQAEEHFLAQASRFAPDEPLAGPLSLDLLCVFPIPASYSKKRAADCLNGVEFPAKKPDLDNIAKTVTDAMNGIFYGDDAQLVDVHVRKIYGTVAGYRVRIEEFTRRRMAIEGAM